MDQDQVLEALRLSPSRLAAVASATEGYAEVVESGGLSEPVRNDAWLLRRASAYTIAAILRLLEGDPRAGSLFRRASALQRERGAAAADVLAMCAAARTGTAEHRVPEDPEKPLQLYSDPEAVLVSRVWRIAAGRDDPESLGEVLDWWRTTAGPRGAFPVGVLGIPLRYYVDVAVSVQRVRLAANGVSSSPPLDVTFDELRWSTRRFLSRAAEPVAAAMIDRRHWTSLAPGILPVQPGILAVSILAGLAAETRAMTLDELLSGAPSESDTLTRLEMVPVWLATRLLDEDAFETAAR
jgi:hypothetical protein